MGFSVARSGLVLVAVVVVAFLAAMPAYAYTSAAVESITPNGGLGVIKGVVRDNGGSGIANATVAIFRVGTSSLLKQVRSSSDGSFIARIIPGTYTVLAVAEGFNPVTLAAVEVGQASELVYGFKLERSGSGNTFSEKSLDRNNSKWRIRAASPQRSIYQNVEGGTPVDDDDAAAVDAGGELSAREENGSSPRRPQVAIETYFAGSESGGHAGLNFASLVPLDQETAFVFAGQTSTGPTGPRRFDVGLKFKPAEGHLVRTNASIGRLGTLALDGSERTLGQFSLQALDEWTIREGVIVVFGVDYSKFIGAGNDQAISPRLGLQFDVDPKTRVRSAFTTQTESRTWSQVIELEDTVVSFREPQAVEDLVVENGKPRLERSSRFEIGIERVLDNNSSVEANVFFDSTFGRGVGLTAMPINDLGGSGFTRIVGEQRGGAQGLRVVYNRRIGSILNAAAGYSFGRGQKLSGASLSDPSSLFENGFFQSLFGQLSADFRTGTNVRTVFRLSPQATVFAIDPFQGRLAIYDPSLSVRVTQDLPTLGLPFHAQAIVDARNLFDFQTGVSTEEGLLRMNSQRRMLRGGILVRF